MLVALAAAAGGAIYYYNHVNDEIRRLVLEKLAGHYAGLKVEVRSALLIDGEGIEIRGVTISDPELSGQAAELAYFDEIVLTCGTELAEFLHGQPTVTHIRVRRPRIRATRLPDGRWSAARLLPCPKFGKHRVEATVENGVVELTDATRPHSPTFTLRELNFELHPVIAEYANGDEPILFEGTLAGDYFQRIDVRGRIEAGGAGYVVEGGVERLEVSPEFRQSLPAELAEPTEALSALRATGSFDFKIAHETGGEAPWTFNVDGHLTRGRYDDPRLPQALTELTAEFHADNQGLILKEVTAKFGQSSLHCFAQLHGFSPGAPLFADLRAEHLLIGRSWERALGPEWLESWKKFEPAGEVDARLILSYDGRRWQPEIKVDCRNVSFTFYKFPYRVDRARGSLALKDSHLSMNLVAQGAGKPIIIKGEVDRPGPHFTGAVEISGRELPIEPRIIDALPAKSQEIVRSLNPSGLFSFYTRVYRDDPNQRAPHQYLTLDLKHGWVRYEKFPYPIGNIHGMVEMQNGAWWSDDLQGTNDTGRITCDARLEPTAEGPELTMHFTGRDVPLEEELRDALAPQGQKVWNDLRPRGSIDLTADVHYLAAAKKPDIRIRIERFGPGASLEPIPFPYRMEGLRGGGDGPVFVYDSRESRVDFARLRAMHGRTSLSATGSCTFNDQGAWRLHFKRLSADGLRVDGELLAALPAGLKKVAAQLSPTGPISLDGSLELSASGVAGEPLRSGWNLDFNVQQASLNAGVLLENVTGSLHLEGQHDGRQVRSTGELAIDSLTFKDFQFTDIRGPLWIDDGQIIIGSRADRPGPGRLPRRVTAKLYGGTALAELWVGFGPQPRYDLQATLTDGDLERFAREQLAGKQDLKGKVGAGLVLSGTGTALYQMQGRGEVRLREADIYELPLMVQLLKILSIRPPDKTAFTASDVEFDIAGEHIDLKQIEFSGDAISLLGKGEMNFNSDIRARLSAIVGRSEWQLPVFKSVMGQASQQIMEIHVDGNLTSPHIWREPFPGINQAIQQLQAGMQPRPQPPAIRTPLPQAAARTANPMINR